MHMRFFSPLALSLFTLATACSSAGASSLGNGTGTGTGGDSGSGTGGSMSKGGSSTAQGGSSTAQGGTSGTDPDAGIITTGGTSQGGSAGGPDDGGLTQDAKPDVEGAGGCVANAPPGEPGPLAQKCPGVDVASECGGTVDLNPALPNGMYGNGFDDDCDGLVDEGCACDPDHGVGTTKDCYLLPSSQADPTTKQPVGWCKTNAKGTVACVQSGGGEFVTRGWDGFCKGAQKPFADDVCAPGDFDCDGVDSNSRGDNCSCPDAVEVTCPTDPIVISPYPDPNDLEKKKPNPFDPKPQEPFIIDGYKWITKGDPALASDWVWSVTGGDCDNVLPHPTFVVYGAKVANTQNKIGIEAPDLGSNKKQKGWLVGFDPGSTNRHQIWPAFSLSGDYLVEGYFKAADKQYSCKVKVQVRWPGVRVEMCWDMAKTAALGLSSSDLDLHVARLQNAQCNGQHGWFDTCGKAPQADDCWYDCESGCRTKNQGFCAPLGIPKAPTPPPGWGYGVSGYEACHGWGSLRENQQDCDNPRLDRDNLGCNVNIVEPTATFGLDNPALNYCGPENINIDNPNPGDQFLAGVHFYGGASQLAHVNVYCNGERKLALGYDPSATPPITYPRLKTGFNEPEGQTFFSGDMWEVARVTWKGDAADPCTIEPIPSKVAKPDKDGSTNLCVDTNAQNKSSPTQSDKWLFKPGGGIPRAPETPAGDICWH